MGLRGRTAHSRRWGRSSITALVALSLVSGGCSSTKVRSADVGGEATTGPVDVVPAATAVPSQVHISTAEVVHVDLPGVVTIDGPAGSVTGDLGVAPVTLDLPEQLEGVNILATGGVRVTMVGEPTAPLTLRFTVPQDLGASLTAVHVADDGTLEAIPSELVDGRLVVSTQQFSVVGWISGVWNFVFGTTSPNSCTTPPVWASVASHPESVHACVGTNVDSNSGRIRAELDIKSNRGTWQEMYLPSQSVDYLWGEGQPGWMMDLYRAALGESGGYVLLPPDSRVTMGFVQPSSFAAPAVTVAPPDEWLFYLTSAAAIADAAGWKARDAKVLLALLTGLKCLGGDVFPIKAPQNLLSGAFDKVALIKCAVSQLKDLANDPEKWVDNLPEAVSSRIPQSSYASITGVAKGVGNAALVLTLLSYTSSLFSQISDQVISAFGILEASQVTVFLDPVQPSTTVAPTQTTPATSPQAAGQLSISLSENPFLCDGGTRALGTLSGASPGERVTFASPTVSGLLPGNADGAGRIALKWQCNPAEGGQTWNVTATSASGRSGSFSITGRSPQPTATPTTAAPSATTFTETTGVVTNTWSDYTNAGGTAGARIPKYTSVQISCRIEGFRVQNGNTWWYRIASSPWSNAFYASADAFYNNGATGGPIAGTPYVDLAVPLC